MRAFIKFDGIAGESTSKSHKDEVEVIAWNWGLEQTGSTSSGSGTGIGKVRPHDFTFVHAYDRASPLLAKAAATGKHIKDAVVSVARTTASTSKDYLKFSFKDVLVTSVDVAGDDDQVTEQVSLSPAVIAVDYLVQNPTGAAGDTVSFTANFKNAKFS